MILPFSQLLARSQAEILCKSLEDEITALQRECLASLQNLDPVS